jgi:hypothetical protein
MMGHGAVRDLDAMSDLDEARGVGLVRTVIRGLM